VPADAHGCARAGVAEHIDGLPDAAWDRAARLHAPGRSGGECRARWAHRLRPGINLGAWAPAEDARLAQLAEQHGRANVRPRTAASLARSPILLGRLPLCCHPAAVLLAKHFRGPRKSVPLALDARTPRKAPRPRAALHAAGARTRA